MIPLFYALAVFVSGVASLYLGKLYDRYGMKVIFFTSMLSALFVPFVFSSNSAAILFGMVLWGVGWGSQGSILRAAVSRWVSTERRATAYGILNFSLGVFSFLNGAIIGLLIDRSLIGMILFSLIAQFLALPLLYLVGRYETNR
jgi:MFS family permease